MREMELLAGEEAREGREEINCNIAFLDTPAAAAAAAAIDFPRPRPPPPPLR